MLQFVLLLLSISQASTSSNTCMLKSVSYLIPRASRHWVGDGFHVRPAFGSLAFTKSVSPFLMLDYANEKFQPNANQNKRRGVGQHPHRGFETVTIAFQGEIEHADSAGNRDVIKKGDVQWMTAGRGIIHEEFHGIEWAKKGGTVEMVQLWVNLKSKDKMVKPRYQPISTNQIPTVDLSMEEEDGSSTTIGTLRVVAGSYGEVEGPAQTHSEMNVWDIELNATSEQGVQLRVPEGHNTLLLVRSGSVDVMDDGKKRTSVHSEQVVMFNREGNAINIASTEGTTTKVLLLSGVPFNEPIANMGPFVMNTQAELRTAQRDYSSGNFGT